MSASATQNNLPELTITRVFDAPRELMFRLWTEPEHISRWWGPHDFTVPHAEFDARPGGRLRIDFRGPDGEVFPNYGEVARFRPSTGWCSPPNTATAATGCSSARW